MPRLVEEGYCVYTLNLGETLGVRATIAKLYGTNHIRESAGELGRFVERVQDASGAPQVDLVGWSQGEVIIRLRGGF